jgi:hypothetical protein
MSDDKRNAVPPTALDADGQKMTNDVRDSDDADLPALDPKVQAMLGRSLKAHYDDIVSAPVPDRFLLLLAELEAKEQDDDK